MLIVNVNLRIYERIMLSSKWPGFVNVFESAYNAARKIHVGYDPSRARNFAVCLIASPLDHRRLFHMTHIAR
jgi:hypothetical protein